MKLLNNTLISIFRSKLNVRILISIMSLFLFWLLFTHYTRYQQIAITRNIFTGDVNIDTVPGINITPPWVQSARIDLKPIRVCIDCRCNNIDCKLVSFNINGWNDFVNKEGFRYYWLSNRISFNSGNKEEYRGMRNILRGYSFDNNKYSFLREE